MKFNSTDIGCYGDSARGIYLDVHVVEFAIAHGFTLDQSEPDNALVVDNEFLGEIADEAIEYLNSITDTSAVLWGYSDNGDFGLWELEAE